MLLLIDLHIIICGAINNPIINSQGISQPMKNTVYRTLKLGLLILHFKNPVKLD